MQPDPPNAGPSHCEPRASARAASRHGTYLLTWTTYGTWLPGDARGFVGPVPDGAGGTVVRNTPGTPDDHDMPDLERRARERLAGDPAWLAPSDARVREASFRETADRYHVRILAGAILGNRVHPVARRADRVGAEAHRLFKGASSRRLRIERGACPSARWWTRQGSRRPLTTDRSVAGAIAYVLREQMGAMIVFTHEPEAPARGEPGARGGASAG